MRSAVLHGSRVLHSRDDRTTRRSLTVETLYIGPDRGHIFVVPRPAAPVFRTLVAETHVAGRKLHHHEASDVVAHRTPTKGQLRGTLRGAGARVRATARMSCCDAVGAQIVAREEDGTRVRREMGCGWGIDRREQQRTASFCVAERGPARARRARGKSAQREECGRARKAGGAAHASGAALMWQRFCVCSLALASIDRSFVRVRRSTFVDFVLGVRTFCQ